MNSDREQSESLRAHRRLAQASVRCQEATRLHAGRRGEDVVEWVTLVSETHRLSALRRRQHVSAVEQRGSALSVSIAGSVVRDDADEGQESRGRVSDEHANAVLSAVVNERNGLLVETSLKSTSAMLGGEESTRPLFCSRCARGED